ncbi:MAG: glycosyltransferase family 4 protein [Phycisphaerae bacterium]|nr:glycosyltransferase family 4 protein [Phycisphaerae bacterium]
MSERLLIVAGDLELGGGQIFAVRLANALARSMSVSLVSADPARCDARLRARVAPNVDVVPCDGSPAQLASIVRDGGYTAVNSHLWQADALVERALAHGGVRWTISMHGCYELLLETPDAVGVFRPAAERVLRRANAVVIAAEKNRRVFERFGLDASHVVRIPYGYEPVVPQRVERPRADVVFGIASRAVPNKGWEQAFYAFARVRAELLARGVTSALVLVGGGPLVPILRDLGHPDVHVTDWVADPESWIAGFDIAMLPTSYPGESYPNSVIEYLALEKPIVATRWAEIPAMVATERGSAATLIGMDAHGTADIDALAAAMLELATDRDLRAARVAAATSRSRAFSMDECVRRYRAVLC